MSLSWEVSLFVNDFTQKLGLKRPLIVAPMAGGPSSPELVIATSKAGGLGSIGSAYSSPAAMIDFVNKVRKQTKNPIAINLFIPSDEPQITEAQISKALAATEKYRLQLNLPQPKLVPPYEENFDEQFEALLKLKPEVFSFVFGLLKPEYVKAAKKQNIFLIGTATTLEEALALQESGVEALTLQGVEAGGHRGIFRAESPDPEISLLNLLEQCVGKIKIPVVAAGGLMNASDIKTALSKGAGAVQLGTAFLTCKEAGTSQPYLKALQVSAERKTKITRAYSGRLARGIENPFMLDMDKKAEAILAFPAQNKFTRDIRAASAQSGSSDGLSLWAGTGKGSLWTGPAAELIDKLFMGL